MIQMPGLACRLHKRYGTGAAHPKIRRTMPACDHRCKSLVTVENSADDLGGKLIRHRPVIAEVASEPLLRATEQRFIKLPVIARQQHQAQRFCLDVAVLHEEFAELDHVRIAPDLADKSVQLSLDM